jgi:sugar phosphate isomerase/epimerase
MRDLTRRELIGVLLAAPVGLAARQGTPYRGVTIGVQSYSFRDRSLDAAIDGMAQIGLKSCELWQGHLEPRNGTPREDVRKWRETASLDEFRRAREKFEKAGIALSAYNISFKDDFSDAEIERGFEMAKALGAPAITASANVKVVPRVAPVAARHKIKVGMHNHSQIDPNEFATPANMTDAARAPGGFIAINLDIGHFTAANFDAMEFLKANHDKIVTLHIKDRGRDQGPAVPFGQGAAPIGPVLRLLRDRKSTIPANIEYEYKGDTISEVKKCFEYCRRELDS